MKKSSLLTILCITLGLALIGVFIDSCNKSRQLKQALESQLDTEVKFEELGMEVKQLRDERDSIYYLNKALQLSQTQLELLVKDLGIAIKGIKPVVIVKQSGTVEIPNTGTVDLNLPCIPFDTTFTIDSTWYNFTVVLTDKVFSLQNIYIPYTSHTIISVKNRFLRSPEISTIVQIDNPYFKVQSLSSAVEKRNKGMPWLERAGFFGAGFIINSLIPK